MVSPCGWLSSSRQKTHTNGQTPARKKKTSYCTVHCKRQAHMSRTDIPQLNRGIRGRTCNQTPMALQIRKSVYHTRVPFHSHHRLPGGSVVRTDREVATTTSHKQFVPTTATPSTVAVHKHQRADSTCMRFDDQWWIHRRARGRIVLLQLHHLIVRSSGNQVTRPVPSQTINRATMILLLVPYHCEWR